MPKDQMKYFVEKRGNRELVSVFDTLQEARAMVKGGSDIIVCQTRERREEIRETRELAKKKMALDKQKKAERPATRST